MTDGAGSAPPTPVALSRRTEGELPLSAIQERIWAAQRLHPGVPLANMGQRHRITGPVDPELLSDAFDAVVRESDMLRAVVEPGRRPVLHILAAPPRRTEVVELSADELDRWCAERIAVAIDPTECCYDSVLLRHGPEDWTWWLDLHHLATDAWSSALVVAATSARYAAASSGSEVDVPSDLLPFATVVEGGPDDDERRARRIEAWRAEAVDGPRLAPFGPRGVATTAVERHPLGLDQTEIDDLYAALDGPYASLSTELGLLGLLCSCVAAVVHRLDGRTEVTIGVPVHHRSGRRLPRVVGPLMEIYPVTIRVEPEATFASLVEVVRHQLIDLLRRARPGESPETDVEIIVNVLTARVGDFAGMPTTTDWMRSGHVEPAHVVRVQSYDYGDGLRLEVDLNEGLSVDGSHGRLLPALEQMLRAATASPDRSIAAVDLTTDDDRRLAESLGRARADDATEYDRPVHEVIRDRLRADPGRVVAEHDGRTLDAAALDDAADRLASWLGESGVVEGRRIGIQMSRSLDVLIAVQGILRAGAAFVMLDPEDPPARRALIAEEAGLALVLTELPALDGTPATPTPAAPRATGLDDLAYILYTSGSTGVPKGVPISHRGLADYLAFAIDAYVDDDVETVMPLHSRLVFDLTITSLFLPLLAGGRTIVIGEEGVDGLARVAADRRINLLKATPTQLELIARLTEAPGATDGPLPVRVAIVGGEAFRRPVAVSFAAACAPGVRIFNEYGPTEAVVGCMIHEWDPALDVGPDVPIGGACPGASVALLDVAGQPVTSGAWGELYVRRPGMATGYLDRPELDAERFVEPPGLPGSGVWYRTGDRARMERPGVLVYGGRADDQLKVNGIRVEPGEIEAALVGHPAVANAVVRLVARQLPAAVSARCVRCGLGEDVPGVTLDDERMCSVCRSYDAVRAQADAWFADESALEERRLDARRRSRGDYDCLHLLSGGKDSTYALYQLVERGWRVRAMTLDNGYLSDEAMANVRRTTEDLGVPHDVVTTSAMNEILRDSLDRYSNVCNGCYKTIYTLAVAKARDLGIPVIVTGLSRGQFFETRLLPHQFEEGRFDPDAIDATVLEARRVYHQTPDAVTASLPEQAVFDDPDIFDEIQFVDLYRYLDVELSEMLEFLETRAPWVRPSDTGRSTNCLVNDVGIWVHRHERGYHNYAEPYSWDIRLGHKTRDEALEELDDDIDETAVQRMLDEIGYEPKVGDLLTAWFQTVPGQTVAADELRAHLVELLPAHAVPAAFVPVEEIPLAASGKVDVDRLPRASRGHRAVEGYVPPRTDTERSVCAVFERILGETRVGVLDDFFLLGGASLDALETVAQLEELLSVELADAAVFRHRTAAALASAIDGTAAAGRAPDVRTVEEPPADQPVPLSAGEAALLYAQRVDPADTRYNVSRLYRIGGEVDAGRLIRALGELVELHGPLHISYAADRRSLAVEEALDVRVLERCDRDAFDDMAEELRLVPFDLDDGPLVRARIAPTGDDEVSILLSTHHISIDAGTFDTLWEQLVDRYQGDPLPELPYSYAALGQHQARHRSDDARRYWAEQRRAKPERDRPSGVGLAPPVPPEPDGYVERSIALTRDDLVAGGAATPFAAALSAAAITLARFNGDRHVDIGVITTTKDHAGAAPLVGYHLNTLPLGLTVDGDETVAAFVERSSDTVRSAMGHRTYPYAEMVRDARAASEPIPDVSCMISYEELRPVRFPGAATGTHRIIASGVSIAETLTFFVQERDDDISLGLEWCGARIARDDAVRLIEAFEESLAFVARAPDEPVAEALRDVATSTFAGAPLSVEGHLLDRIVVVAGRQPTTSAVIDGGGTTLTYAELLERAGRLAGAIRDASVRSGRPAPRRVGVSIERRADLVAAVLAAQLAGAAYVPLDPSSPPARLASILEVADPDVVVASADGPGFGDRPVVTPDSAAPTEVDVEQMAASVATTDPAYLVFTSGTTGTPRGVQVSHGSLAASTMARDLVYDDRPHRFLLTSSIGFDSSIVGLFWPLAAGGTVVLPDDDVVGNLDRLTAFAEAQRVTHLLTVPSLYRAMLDRAPSSLAALSTAIVAGEACPASLPAQHREAVPTAALFNEYGPSEAAVWCTVERLDGVESGAPIGRPIPGVEVRIADGRGDPVPRGVAAELWVSGPTLADGYLDDPEATTARFPVVDGRRWYRTGDVVRADDDGVLTFVGRLDDQLNVGGVRLEPGEVERHIEGFDGVEVACVVAATDRPVLVAHLEGTGVDIDALRRHLDDVLPATHVPRRFGVHDHLPRTSHGKLDRAAVASLPADAPATRRELAPSSDPDVRTAVAVWREVLASEAIDSSTDYFLAGGDSLAAIELVNRLSDRLERRVPIAALLDGRTPAGMIDEVRRADEPGSSPVVAPDRRVVQVGAAGGATLLVIGDAWLDLEALRAEAPATARIVVLLRSASSGPGPDTDGDVAGTVAAIVDDPDLSIARSVVIAGRADDRTLATSIGASLVRRGAEGVRVLVADDGLSDPVSDAAARSSERPSGAARVRRARAAALDRVGRALLKLGGQETDEAAGNSGLDGPVRASALVPVTLYRRAPQRSGPTVPSSATSEGTDVIEVAPGTSIESRLRADLATLLADD